MRTVTVADLPDLEGAQLGSSSWHEISQDQINQFADATGDHQWIHIDPERAAAGPFGTTIAHGYLTLAVIPALLDDLLQVEGTAQAINYGLDKVRFPAPVPVGSRIRLTAAVDKVEQVPRDTRWQSPPRSNPTPPPNRPARRACSTASYGPRQEADRPRWEDELVSARRPGSRRLGRLVAITGPPSSKSGPSFSNPRCSTSTTVPPSSWTRKRTSTSISSGHSGLFQMKRM